MHSRTLHNVYVGAMSMTSVDRPRTRCAATASTAPRAPQHFPRQHWPLFHDAGPLGEAALLHEIARLGKAALLGWRGPDRSIATRPVVPGAPGRHAQPCVREMARAPDEVEMIATPSGPSADARQGRRLRRRPSEHVRQHHPRNPATADLRAKRRAERHPSLALRPGWRGTTDRSGQSLPLGLGPIK